MKKLINAPWILFVISVLCTVPYYFLLHTNEMLYLTYLYGQMSRGVFYIGNFLILIISIKYYKNTKKGSFLVPIIFALIAILIPILSILFVLLEYYFLLK